MRVALAAALILGPGAAPADTDFTALSPSERAAFHREIRAVLLANPELVQPRLPEPQDAYADAVASDIALIAANAAALFGPDLADSAPGTVVNRIALFTAPDCLNCARAEADLRALAEGHNLQLNVFERARHPDLADRLGVDALPFYVFPRMMLRGYMLAPVIARYLEQHTGQ